MSSSLFLAATTLVLLSLIPFSSAFLVDVDGDQIRNGADYYIVPISSESSLTYTQRNDGCPLYITLEKDENSRGTPVTISTPLRKLFIDLGERVILAFNASSEATPCKGSLAWKRTLNPFLRKFYITTGSDVLGTRHFSVTKRDRSLLPTYELQYCISSDDESCSNVGLFDSGLLGITQYSTTISFKKAFEAVDEVATS